MKGEVFKVSLDQSNIKLQSLVLTKRNYPQACLESSLKGISVPVCLNQDQSNDIGCC